MLFALLLCQVFSLVVITASVSVEISRAVTFSRLSRATLQRQHWDGSCRHRRGLTAVFMPPWVGSSEDTFHTCADKLTLGAKFYVFNSPRSWAPISHCIYGLTSRRGGERPTHTTDIRQGELIMLTESHVSQYNSRCHLRIKSNLLWHATHLQWSLDPDGDAGAAKELNNWCRFSAMCIVTELECRVSCLSRCHGGHKILEHMIMRTGVRRVIDGVVGKRLCRGGWTHEIQKYARH